MTEPQTRTHVYVKPTDNAFLKKIKKIKKTAMQADMSIVHFYRLKFKNKIWIPSVVCDVLSECRVG